MKKAALFALLLTLASAPLLAEDRKTMLDHSPIQDNSFLVEEAYNQEAGIVQHINTFTRLWNSKAWNYTFTQEWPVPDHWRHQLSYSLTALKPGEGLDAGLGDTMLNYRYQLIGDGEAKLAVAPRLSLIAPSGSSDHSTGYGGWGVQTMLPASVVLSKQFVAHADLGGTLVPEAKDAAGDQTASYGYTAAGSLVWLTNNRFNGLFETVWSSSHIVSRPNGTDVQNTLWLNPGVRWAYNLKSGLQIVPGLAYTLGAGPSWGEKGVFVYLSFEHLMWREKE